MKFDSREMQALSKAQPARVDLYASIHKAIRAMMADALLALGRLDVEDEGEVSSVSDRIVNVLDFCTHHVQHENEFVHAAIEARAAGASAAIAHEHDDHIADIAHLRTQLSVLGQMRSRPQAATLALDLYRELALFVANNFQHMHVEETAHNAVLWARYTDAELLALHDRLLASIAPAEMMLTLRWLVPYMNPAERNAVLSDMQINAPAPAFEAALGVVKPHLTASEWAKLTRSLGLPSVPGLVTA